MHILTVSELDLQEFDKNQLTVLPPSGNIPMPTEFNDNMSCFIEFSKYDDNGRYDSLKFCFNDFLHYLNNTVKLLNTRIYDLEEKVKRDNEALSSNSGLSIDTLRDEMYSAHEALSSANADGQQLCGIWGYNKLINDLRDKVNTDNEALSSNSGLSIDTLRDEMYSAHEALSSANADGQQLCGIWGYNKRISELSTTVNSLYLHKTSTTPQSVASKVTFNDKLTGTITNADRALTANEATKAYWS